MFRYLFWRVLGLIGELILISVITFAISRAVPGGPYDEGEIPFTADQKAAFMKRYGLDRPLHEQYLTYVWNALHLDFGISFQSPSDTVMQLIARTWPVSIQLGSMALAIGFAAGLGLGIIAALRQNTWVDYLATLVSAITIAVPNFVVGILLIIVFGVILKWLPTGGWDSPKHWILPVFAYASPASCVKKRHDTAADYHAPHDPGYADWYHLHRVHVPHPWARCLVCYQ
jgi:ABC-type dipeptide/oligopeptide/nickel transport system permease component